MRDSPALRRRILPQVASVSLPLVQKSQVRSTAAQALEKGIDPDGKPVTRAEVADGIRRLVHDAREDTGIVATVLNREGLNLYGDYLKLLEEVASRISPQ